MSEQAGTWIRVSTGEQDEANQIPDVEAWCKAHGYTIVKPYSLHGQSASKGKQQAKLDEVIADMKSGLISVLVVWASDRIERRGAYNAFQLAEQVRQAGGRIEYVKDEYLNSVNEMSDVMLALAATQNKMESKRKSDRSKMTVQRIRAEGAFYGRVPWGYVAVGEKYHKRLEATPDGLEHIPQIFQMVTDGISLQKIAVVLETETGEQMWAKTIGSIVRNTAYMGSQTDSEGKIVYQAPPLVDANVWQQANDALDSREARGPMANENKALLQGCIFCADCGSPVYKIDCGNTRKDGSRNHNLYYRCSGKGRVRKGCGVMVLMSKVDSAFWDLANERLDVPVIISEFIPGHGWDAEVKEVEFRLSRLGMQGLTEDEEDIQRAALRAVRDDFKSREAEPGRWESTELAHTYLEEIAFTPTWQRGRWLVDHDIRTYLSKTQLTFVMPNGDAFTHDL